MHRMTQVLYGPSFLVGESPMRDWGNGLIAQSEVP